jgi:putative FmdB family regulatory protein
MPIYEYRCEKCGKVFEVLQRFSDEPVKIHEECGGQVEKLISQSAFQLKGSGWYATDYAKAVAPAPVAKTDGKAESGSSDGKASDGKASDGKAESSSESKSDSKSESKSDSTSETKSESKPAVSTTAKTD